LITYQFVPQLLYIFVRYLINKYAHTHKNEEVEVKNHWHGEEEVEQVHGLVGVHLATYHHGKDLGGYTEEVLAGGF